MTADLQWVAADGTVYDLNAVSGANTATTGQHLAGKRGRFAPPVTARYEPIAGANGQRLVDVRLDGREVTIPFAVVATSAATCRAAVNAWARRLDPTAGDGALRVNDSSPARELVCRYVGGLEGAETWEDRGLYSYRAMLILRSEDPYWQALTTSSVAYSYTTGTGTAWFPIFPLRLAAGAELAAGSGVDNTGDVDVWPTITATGPFTSLTLRSVTFGRSITVTTTVAAGQTLTIDTAPRTRTVDLAGVNAWADLTTREWWPLAPGVNDITVSADNATGTTSVVLSWLPRFLSV